MIPWSSIASVYIVDSRTGGSSRSGNGFGLALALLSLGLVCAAVGLHLQHLTWLPTVAKAVWIATAVTFFGCGMCGGRPRLLTALEGQFCFLSVLQREP